MRLLIESFGEKFTSAVLLAFLILLTGCMEEEHITEVNIEEIEFGEFVELNFPFITTSVDARELGPELAGWYDNCR